VTANLVLRMFLALPAAWADDETPGAQESLPVPTSIQASEIEPEEAAETMIVVSDRFKRWDGTRWFIKTEVFLPIPLLLLADENLEFSSGAFQVRTILACEKDWRLSRRRYEVSCSIEDFGLRATAVGAANDSPERRARIQSVLDELDRKLSQAKVQLQVTDDGRVVDIDLEGVLSNNRRTTQMHETLRLLLSRVAVGFDMKLDFSRFGPGSKWVEYTSGLMTLPVQNQASQGTSILIHRLQMIDGHAVVESRGKGNVAVSEANWMTELAGVSVYDGKSAYMRERVWTLRGDPTASNWLGNALYAHAGRIIQLRSDQRPSVGPTLQVSLPGQQLDGIEPWTPLEQ
jgi:hypothetical protein